MSTTPPDDELFIVHRSIGRLESYTITDQQQNELYRLKGKFSLTRQLWSMVDSSGQQVAEFERPPMHIHPQFVLHRPGQADATVRKVGFHPVNETWVIEGLPEGQLDINGNISDHEFAIADSKGTPVAQASRKWVTFTDRFAVHVSQGDPIPILAAIVGIDDAEHARHH